MAYLERIILSIYFPQFHSPSNSRFESFFVSIKKQENQLSKKFKPLFSTKIYPEKIARNEDKRTSLIIKGIPCDMSKNEVRNLIDKFGNINFLYITKSPFNNEENSSIAFVNVINYKSIIPIFMNLRKLKIEKLGQIFKIKIIYSSAQGKQQLKEFIKNKKFLTSL